MRALNFVRGGIAAAGVAVDAQLEIEHVQMPVLEVQQIHLAPFHAVDPGHLVRELDGDDAERSEALWTTSTARNAQ